MSAGLPSLGLQSGMIPRVTPPISVPFRPLIAPLLLLPLALNLIDRAGGGQFRDGQLAKLGKSYDPSSGLSKPYFGGQVADRISDQSPPPFNGGQSVGIKYRFNVDGKAGLMPFTNTWRNISGAIGDASFTYNDGISDNWDIIFASYLIIKYDILYS